MKNHYKKISIISLIFILIFLVGIKVVESGDKAIDGTGTSIEESGSVNSIDEFYKEESVLIAKYVDNVKRVGDTLLLTIESGAHLTFKNSLSCVYPSACDYTFVDYYRDSGFYLIFAGYYEGEDYIMISDKDGKEYSVKEIPRLSPDKERIVSVSACEVYCNNGVFIWRIAGDGLVSELFYEPEEYARYSFVEWKDNRTIELSKKVSSILQLCPKSKFMTVPVILRLEEGGWEFYDDLSSRNIICGPGQAGSNLSR